QSLQRGRLVVESRMGAVAWGLWPTPRFPSPLIEPDVPISGIRLVWGFSCQGGPQHGPSLFLLRFLGPFFCSTAPQAFFRPDRKMPNPTRAAAVKDGAFLQCRPKGPLVLDGREDGGML